MTYCHIIISATSKAEANLICDSLLQAHLIAGGLIIDGPSRYWWEGRVVERKYFNIQAFSRREKKDEIVAKVKALHADECPIVAFYAIDGNKELLDWIDESVR
ncbi:MAG: divalent cation tolerance protein CutA [Nanoarchaeota archaeon]